MMICLMQVSVHDLSPILILMAQKPTLMSDESDSLTDYLSEIYKNLNLITSDILSLEEQEEIDIDSTVLVNTLENRFSEWMGSFYNILVYLFCTTVAFLISVVNIDYRILALTMFAFFPVYLWFTFLFSIPEITINDRVVFSRNDLTLKKQIQLARSLFVFFMRQLYILELSLIGVCVY